jgi:hypothetical protein
MLYPVLFDDCIKRFEMFHYCFDVVAIFVFRVSSATFNML